MTCCGKFSFWILPLLFVAGAWALVHFDCLTISKAIMSLVGALLVYVLVLLKLYGFFRKPNPKVVNRGPFVYYYAIYQDSYRNAATRFMARFNQDQLIALERSGAVWLGWYWDDPRSVVDQKMCRSLMGFAITDEASMKDVVEISKVSDLRRVELPAWKAVEDSLKVISNLSYMVAPMLLIGHIIDYLMKNHPKEVKEAPMYELDVNRVTTYGCIFGSNTDAINALKPFPDPKLNARGEAMMANWKKCQ